MKSVVFDELLANAKEKKTTKLVHCHRLYFCFCAHIHPMNWKLYDSNVIRILCAKFIDLFYWIGSELLDQQIYMFFFLFFSSQFSNFLVNTAGWINESWNLFSFISFFCVCAVFLGFWSTFQPYECVNCRLLRFFFILFVRSCDDVFLSRRRQCECTFLKLNLNQSRRNIPFYPIVLEIQKKRSVYRNVDEFSGAHIISDSHRIFLAIN